MIAAYGPYGMVHINFSRALKGSIVKHWDFGRIESAFGKGQIPLSWVVEGGANKKFILKYGG